MGRSGVVVLERGQMCERYPAPITVDALLINKKMISKKKE